MYINFKNFGKSCLSSDELILLCAIKQENTAFIELFCNLLPALKEKELITEIKGTKKQTQIEKTRLSSKGKDLLEKLEEIEVSEDTEVIFNWLANYYKNIGKEVGNKNKTKRWIETFSQKTGIKRNNLVILCKAFVSDENNMEYSHKLENVFYRPKTVYETKFNLEESRLYKFYKKHEEQFKNIFKKEG